MGAAAAGAAIGLSLVGAYQQAKASREAAKYNAEVSKRDAYIADLQSADARLRGFEVEQRLGKEADRVVASQRAALAAQGVDVESETALQLQESTARSFAQDQQTIRNNAIREAWGYQVRAQTLRAQAGAQIAAGNSAATGQMLAGVSNAALIAGSSSFGGSSAPSTVGSAGAAGASAGAAGGVL